MTNCMWCGGTAEEQLDTVYWELPDGTRAVEITETPSVGCTVCGAVYQSDETVKSIEDQLFLINTKELETKLAFVELMNKKRLLKRNYFDFS